MKLMSTLVFAGAFIASSVAAETTTLKLHHFIPEADPLHANFLVPFAERVSAASDGRLVIDIAPDMSLGGVPPELIDQAVNGTADMVFTLPGFTPGRFPRSEAFELAFLTGDGIATSELFWSLIESDFQSNECADVKVLAGWVHGPAAIHSNVPITRLEDLQGLSIQAITGSSASYFEELQADVTRSAPGNLVEALSSNTAQAVIMPWEPTPSLGLADAVSHHIEFAGNVSLYTSTHILAMNPDSYAGLPPDLRAILDAEAGLQLSLMAAEAMFEAWETARGVAREAGNEFTTLDDAEVGRWLAASQPTWDQWSLDTVSVHEFDGYGLIDTILSSTGS